MKNFIYIAALCSLAISSSLSGVAKADTFTPADSYTFLMSHVTNNNIDLSPSQIETLQDTFSIVLTYNGSAGTYGGVDFTLNVLDPAALNNGLIKYTPNGNVGLYVEPDDFFIPYNWKNNNPLQLFTDGAKADSPVTATLQFASGTTWESFASFIEDGSFIIVGHLQSLNLAGNVSSIQGATLVWESKIERDPPREDGSTVTPEPASLLIFGFGAAGCFPLLRRRMRKNAG